MTVVFSHVLAVFIMFIITVNLICDIKSECILHINKDLASTGPVFIRDNDFMAPNNKDGTISFATSEKVTVACPGKRIVLGGEATNHDVLDAHCINHSIFRVDGQHVPFKDIACNNQPWFTAEETKERCHGHGLIHRVGYKIKNTFYELYEACFDKNLLHTHYVKHPLTPMSRFMQTGLRRPSFIEGNLFGKVSMNELYKVAHQRKQLNAILGPKMETEYISNKQFLTRGHLAARADYTTSAETRATFHYVNTAPQWMRGNAGDWAALEEALRRRVQARGSEVLVITGTHGVMTLPDYGHRMREVYLHADANNNPVVPVPMYFYKVVYDTKDKTAAAFISINSSFYNATTINNLAFCPDTCDENPQYSWLKWRSNDGTYSFCCDYHEFVKEIDYLPKRDVKGRFY